MSEDRSQLLSLSRAARLAGVSRSALQKKIKDGELASFEGLVRPQDVLQAFPQLELEHDTELARVARIKEQAFGRRMRERTLPDAEVLATRLSELGQRFAGSIALLGQYRRIFQQLDEKLSQLHDSDDAAVRACVGSLLTWLNDELGQDVPAMQAGEALAVKEGLLRVLTAHVQLMPSQRDFFVEGAETILEAGLGDGIHLPYGCQDGSCGQCKARLLSGQVKQARQPAAPLDEASRQAGYVLMCCDTAVTDLVVEVAEAHRPDDIPQQQITARVRRIERCDPDLAVLTLRTPDSARLRFFAGQRARVTVGENLSAELAVASCPCDADNLQFHIVRHAGDRFADYVLRELKPADTVKVAGPQGDFLLNEDAPRPIIFLAIDTGFATVKSLFEHAVAIDFPESMHLYRAMSAGVPPYLDNVCRAWADALDNFHYTPPATAQTPESLVGHIVTEHPDLSGFDVYLAGPQHSTAAIRELLLQHGLPPRQLYEEAYQDRTSNAA